jgi:hypothetical protein
MSIFGNGQETDPFPCERAKQTQPMSAHGLVQELRDYPAIDPRETIIAVDPLENGYCIVPRTTVLQAAARIEELEGAAKKARTFIEHEIDVRGPDIAGNGLAALNALDKALSSAK